MTAAAAGQRYALDNHHGAAAAHHRALAELLDPFTTSRITGLCDMSAVDRCLEVGAGGGSIAGWLADRVAPHGEVVACDLKPEQLPPHPRLRPVAHDLSGDDPLLSEVAGAGFDLVVARLTLAHLPRRRTILRRLAGLLAEGGVLLVEDWTALRDDVVVAAPSRRTAELYQRYQHAASSVFDAAGADRTWGRRLHTAMCEEGLTAVETVIHGRYWTGGSAGLRLVGAVAAQLRPRLLAAGMRESELDQLAELLHDPELVVHGHPLYSTSGKRFH